LLLNPHCDTILLMNYWLVKTEPHVYSIDDLLRDKVTSWTGVRNYQARNYLRQMEVGDLVLVYHSNAEPPGVVGIAKVKSLAKPDPTQFDKTSEYFDPAATDLKPRWFCPDLSFVKKLRAMVPLDVLRNTKELDGLLLLKRGSRLSVIPVSREHFDLIVNGN
jgi:predicted RNA-binding protein with PUA-like domain